MYANNTSFTNDSTKVIIYSLFAKIKTEGIEQTALRHRFKPNLLQAPLMSSVVAPNLHDFTIANARVRFHMDKSHNLHSNGELNQQKMSSHLRYVNTVECERTITACIQYLPSVKGL